MPFAVALLCHPAGAYGFLIAALGAFVYAWHTRAFLPAFTAASAAALTALAFLHVPPDFGGLLLLLLGVALLQCELIVPTYGAALLAGLGASACGSWLLLAPAHGATVMLAVGPKLALTLAGPLALFGAVLSGFRRRTLPSPSLP